MIRISLAILFTIGISSVFGQVTGPYSKLIHKADSLYTAKEYKLSAESYSSAFKANRWRATPLDRYNAACSWALAGVPDSSFHHLNRLAKKGNFSNYGHITTDSDLNSLHGDPRWKPLLQLVQKNKDKEEANYNKPLVHVLDSIYYDDQKDRQMLDGIEKEHGWDSKEMKDMWTVIREKDSINLIKVTKILDRYGWLGPDVIGGKGSATLFLVIQHSNQKTQEKYLPMMRDAVKKGNAESSNLALLEDRVAMGQGKKQIYGSQILQDGKTGKYTLAPIDDEPNVNKRRAEVGLGPLEDYVRRWGIEYKLPMK